MPEKNEDELKPKLIFPGGSRDQEVGADSDASGEDPNLIKDVLCPFKFHGTFTQSQFGVPSIIGGDQVCRRNCGIFNKVDNCCSILSLVKALS